MMDSLFPNIGPRLDAGTFDQFTSLCANVDEGAANDLQGQIRDHLAHIRGHLRFNEFLDVELAERLAEQLIQLLQILEAYSRADQRLIVGAARYFVADDDAEPDTQSILGLDDDLAVFNHVATQIGEPDLRIEM